MKDKVEQKSFEGLDVKIAEMIENMNSKQLKGIHEVKLIDWQLAGVISLFVQCLNFLIEKSELNNELAKILPKSFYEEQGYRKVKEGIIVRTEMDKIVWEFRDRGFGKNIQLDSGDIIFIEEE